MLNSLMLGMVLSIGQASPPTPIPQATFLLPTVASPNSGLAGYLGPIQEKDEKKNGNGNGNGDEKKDDEKKDEPGPWRLFPNEVLGFKVTGWVYGTGVGNPTNTGGTRYNGPLTTNDQDGVFLNQLWLNVSRGLKEEFSWGATVDIFYGNDYLASESRGFENANARGWLPQLNTNKDYGIVFPQSYLELGTTKYSVKLGHFYTPHGYMVVQATGNFFNTLPNGFMWTNPFTHWGGLATASPTDHWTFQLGLVNGWDALDRPVNSAAVMAGIKYNIKKEDKDKGFFSMNMITGQEPENLGPAYAQRTLFTNVLDYKFTDDFEFVLEQNVGWQENRGIGNSCFFNFVPYFFYKINDRWKAGFRYELFHDPGNFASAERFGNPNNGPIAANVLAGPYIGNFHTLAWGLNWAPRGSKNLMIRPELRYDWFNGSGVGGQPFDAGKSSHQIMLMVGAFYLF